MYESRDNITRNVIFPKIMFSVICIKFLNVSASSTWFFYWFKSVSYDAEGGSDSTWVLSQWPSSKSSSAIDFTLTRCLSSKIHWMYQLFNREGETLNKQTKKNGPQYYPHFLKRTRSFLVLLKLCEYYVIVMKWQFYVKKTYISV